VCVIITRRIAGTDDADRNEDASPWKKRDSAAGAGGTPAGDVPDDASWLALRLWNSETLHRLLHENNNMEEKDTSSEMIQ
jgi:hypothetical protein